MTVKAVVGFVGVGLMGHGLAKNIVAKGWPLVFLDHAGNRPTEDISALGGTSVASFAEIAQGTQVIILCVTGSPQVEEIVLGEGGLLTHLGPQHIVVDCSTAIPDSTLRIAEAVAGRGARFLDAPLTRTPKEAEEGRANVLVGADAATFTEVLPILQTFGENIVHVGPVSTGHRMKLLHNYISLGNCVLLAEAALCAKRGGVAMETFIDVLAKGGGDSVALDRMTPFLTQGDPGALRFSLANAHKDLGYYTTMAEAQGVPSRAAQALHEVLGGAVAEGAGAEPVPALVDFLDQRSKA